MRHLPLFFMGQRWIPDLARRTALQRLARPKRIEKPVMRVAYFVGCLINHVYPEIAESVVRVLNRLNVEVVVPREQVCCGAPVASFGDEAAARRLARMNAKALWQDGLDAVVTACASCGRRLKAEYANLLADAWPAAKVFDVSEFILKFAQPDLARVRRRATYHDPCHLLWGQGIGEAPRELLRRSCEYVEMTAANRCCGGGGTFSLFHYDLAIQIAEHKMAGIRTSAADVVATGCPGCQLQLADRMAAAGMDVKVAHTIQVVEEALL
jgi:glycolate oxidase iron-sulfur subunit